MKSILNLKKEKKRKILNINIIFNEYISKILYLYFFKLLFIKTLFKGKLKMQNIAKNK